MEYNTGAPIYLQVINELKKKMVKGELKPGEKMPSSRDLAVEYKVNQNTGDGNAGLLFYKARDWDFRVRGGEYVSGFEKRDGVRAAEKFHA